MTCDRCDERGMCSSERLGRLRQCSARFVFNGFERRQLPASAGECLDDWRHAGRSRVATHLGGRLQRHQDGDDGVLFSLCVGSRFGSIVIFYLLEVFDSATQDLHERRDVRATERQLERDVVVLFRPPLYREQKIGLQVQIWGLVTIHGDGGADGGSDFRTSAAVCYYLYQNSRHHLVSRRVHRSTSMT